MVATQVDRSQCIELRSNPGYYLLKNAAYAWDRAVAEFGKRVLITGSWRSYETQERIFLERYRTAYIQYAPGKVDARSWKGRTWYRKPGFAAAAVPGTSNHGGGLAVDVKTRRDSGDPEYDVAVIFGSWTDTDRTRFLRVAAEHGWDDDEGRSVNELWHLTYYADRDQHRGVKPPTIQQEDDMAELTLDTTQAKQLSETRAIVGELKTLLGGRVDDIGTTAGLTHDSAHERELILLRRIEGQQIAASAAPDAVVDIDATAVADELVKRLPKATAQAVITAMSTQLAK